MYVSRNALQRTFSASQTTSGTRKQQEENVGRESRHTPHILLTQVVPQGAGTQTRGQE